MTRQPKPVPPRCYASTTQERPRVWLCCALPAGHDGDHKANGEHWKPETPAKEPQ